MSTIPVCRRAARTGLRVLIAATVLSGLTACAYHSGDGSVQRPGPAPNLNCQFGSPCANDPNLAH
jgi:hypothetical protein